MKKILFLLPLLALCMTACDKDNDKENGPKKDGDYLNKGYIIYHGEKYNVVKLKDGNWWMAENLRYVPEGKTPSNSLTNVTAGVYYPIVLNGDKNAVVFSTSDADIKTSGYLYQSEVALGLNVGDLTTVAAAQALEGCRGICPEGWHIPTSAEILALVGKSANLTTNTDAPYYDGNNGSIELLNADGFNAAAWGTVTVQNNEATSATLMGYLSGKEFVASGYVAGSTYGGVTYKTPNDETSGVKNLQFHGFMPMAGNGTFNGAKINYRSAVTVRCIKDHAPAAPKE